MTAISSDQLTSVAARPWDVIVVGAGPAGSLAARGLAERGRRVLLVERAGFPRAKVCGCCLNLRALASLRRAGLGDIAADLGAVPLRTVRLAAAGYEAVAQLPGGAALSRSALDLALAQAAVAAGATFLPSTRAVLEKPNARSRTVCLIQGDRHARVSAGLVLAADGLGGRLLARESASEGWPGSRIGAGVIGPAPGAEYADGAIHMAIGRGGYVGAVRLEDGRLDLAAAFDATYVRAAGGLGAAAASTLAQACMPAIAGIEEWTWRGTPALTRRPVLPAAERVFALGDAAGYVEPFTGEGIAWALESALAVVPLAAQACQAWQPDHAARWCTLYKETVRHRQAACATSVRLLRMPRVTAALVAALAQAPWLARPVIGWLNR